MDEIEQLAIDRLKSLFGAEYANVQPHSGAQANTAVYLGLLQPGDAILGFNLSHGGHLTHGSPVNFSGKMYKAHFYGVEEDTGRIDMDKVEAVALRENPKLIICGASAYSREWDYARFRAIADKVGALLMADIAHPAGLIAKGLLNHPFPHCHIVTSTTHKTLRGPRGGLIMLGEDMPNPWGITTPKGELRMLSSLLDSGVFPGMQGGPLEHVIAAKAVSFAEALLPSFRTYGEQVIRNAAAMAEAFRSLDYTIVSGGTDNHSMLIDLRNKGITGKEAENVLVLAGITVNKNMVPFDDKSPMVTSGIRIGTPAITTRGLQEKDMGQIVHLIDEVLSHRSDSTAIRSVNEKVGKMMAGYPLFSTSPL